MGLKDTINQNLTDLIGHDWQTTNGTVVPKTTDIALKNGARVLDAVYLYADMMGSTQLVTDFEPGTAAKVMRAFLSTACRIIRYHDGHIRSFDGDRVMGIFIGDNKNSRAAKAAMEIKYATDTFVWPALERRLPSLGAKGFVLSHVSGIASGKVFMARAGIREHNDLISVGEAANIAAKLSDIRESPQCRTYITKAVYDTMSPDRRVSDGKPMWQESVQTINGVQRTVYRSNWGRVVS
ncbi:adenylate/guanylate cyclase domain-containing protein [Kitasatospora sp. NBC_00240]|uniref:adenylate/guanylate cyclase domain-containing protein n=1 Tax=Kitasatospora sp. NBC_00240 TaxID=2903567 RepID=UPI00224D99DC|nr:adenylate/guanylate cyclase domain-containing protein [Kitasatospora sp. NBC_00240]MCX5215633.1 adenylate/guanylate cyclase domain-containing protein [Kitasatospora sp. NBC_00240]